MTCANRMGQAAKHVSDLALGVCGALLISLAVMTLPSPSQAAAWADAPAASIAAR
ncbi:MULTISPECIES: hypothetical protein [unclassified Brevundimonas]|uniref:hypothetical protein n=1 Tax=unclassified Brevundimonas TaxID=2622653 RepID=UPI001304B31F|nr:MULTISPECIES: hypothetical protein [unclassified Brevundimonas]